MDLNQDIEFPVPESVARVWQAVQEADGIWIFRPEYSDQSPVVLNLSEENLAEIRGQADAFLEAI